MIGKRVSSQKVVYTRLMEVAEERVRERDFGIQSKLHVSENQISSLVL